MIVDKIIQFWCDVIVPGNGLGQTNILHRAIRTVEQTHQKSNIEYDIRQSLRTWDNSHPQIHHELIIRYVCGAIVSLVATTIYTSITRPNYYVYRQQQQQSRFR
jgi:hypothetical protein